MAGTLAPSPRQQFFDNNGDPVAGGLLYTYTSGTTTALPVYADAALTTPHTNPAVLDSAGRITIYLGPYSYKFSLASSTNVLLWTVDPVQAVAPHSVDLDIDGVAGEALTANSVVYLSSGAEGNTAGRWYKTDADVTTQSSQASMVGMVPNAVAQGATGTIRLSGRLTGLSGLTAGATYYCSTTAGGLTASVPTNSRLVGVADSETSLILFSSAVGNTVTVSGIGFTPLASHTGVSTDIVATINASTEGIRIDAGLIEINGTVTFASGYDPSTKIATGGAAADINAPTSTTTVNGGKITTGSINAAQLAANSVTADKILAGEVTASKITVTYLSDIKANLGTITAGTMSAVTFNAGTAGSTRLSSLGLQLDPTTAGTSDPPREIGWKNLSNGGELYIQGYESSTRRALIFSNTTDASHYAQFFLTAIADGSISNGNSSLSIRGASTLNPSRVEVTTYGDVIFTNTPCVRPNATSQNLDLGSSSYKYRNIYLNLPSGGTVPVYTDATGALYYNVSARTMKQDIEPVPVEHLARILELPAITYRWKAAPEMTPQLGLIAEDVIEAGLDELVASKDGTLPSVLYDRIGVALLPLVRSLWARVAALEAA